MDQLYSSPPYTQLKTSLATAAAWTMEAVNMTVLLALNGRRRQMKVVYIMWTCYPLTQDELSCLGKDLCQHNKQYQNVQYQNMAVS